MPNSTQLIIAKEQREEYEETLKDVLEQGKILGEEEGMKAGVEKNRVEVRERMRKEGLSEEEIKKYVE